MKKTISIKLQEYWKTLERNKAIKFRWEHTPEEERWGLLAEMGRQYKITRERIRQIVNRKDSQTTPETHHDGYWALYFKKLMSYLLGR